MEVMMGDVSTLTLTEFLTARIAEDEAIARAPSPSGGRLSWRTDLMVNDDEEAVGFCVVSSDNMAGVADALGLERGTGGAVAAHIARHDPARALAECEAKRRIVEEWSKLDANRYMLGMERGGRKHGLWIALCALAAIHVGHEDFQEDWRL